MLLIKFIIWKQNLIKKLKKFKLIYKNTMIFYRLKFQKVMMFINMKNLIKKLVFI